MWGKGSERKEEKTEHDPSPLAPRLKFRSSREGQKVGGCGKGETENEESKNIKKEGTVFQTPHGTGTKKLKEAHNLPI